MDIPEFDDQISALNGQIDECKEKMEVVAQRLIEALQQHLIDWCKENVQQHVQQWPERVTALGLEGVAKLQEELKVSYDQLPEATSHALNQDGLWNHRPGYREAVMARVRLVSPGYYSETEMFRREGDGSSVGLSPLFHELGKLKRSVIPILEKYNLITSREISSYGLAHAFRFTDPMRKDIQEYAGLLHERLEPYQRQVTELEHKKVQATVQAQANALWDGSLP